MGDRHAQTPCMRKENVKIFPSVQFIGKSVSLKVLALNQSLSSGFPFLQKLILWDHPAQFSQENDMKLKNGGSVNKQ